MKRRGEGATEHRNRETRCDYEIFLYEALQETKSFQDISPE